LVSDSVCLGKRERTSENEKKKRKKREGGEKVLSLPSLSFDLTVLGIEKGEERREE